MIYIRDFFRDIVKGGETMNLAIGIAIGIPVGFGLAIICGIVDIF